MILTELYENLLQAQNINGTLLAGGKVYVYYLGRNDLADTWTDIDGEGLNTNPIILDAQGMCKCYVDTSYDYTVVVKDRYDQLVFTRNKYVVSDGKTQGGGDGVVVQGSNNINVDHTIINDKDVYTISGKDYEGVEPIVVNNDLRRISANTVAFGVREPLYFIQDDDQATIIGMSGDPANTTWVADNFYSASNPSAFVTSGELTSVSANITAMIPTALTGDYLTKDSADTLYYGIDNPSAFVTSGELTAVSADITAMIPTALTGDYLTKDSADTLYQPIGSYLTTADSAKFQPSGSYLSSTDSAKFYPTGNPSGFVKVSEVSSYSGQINSITAQLNNAYSFVAGSGISLTDNTANKTTTIAVTAQGGNTAVEQLVINSSGTWNSVSSKLNKVSADTLYQPIGAYLTTGDSANFYTTANVSGFATTSQLQTVSGEITGLIPTDLFTKASADTLYQPIGAYLTTGDSANFYTTANESGFATTSLVSSVSADVISSLTSADYELVAGSGISIVDDSTAKTTTISVTGASVPEGVLVESGLEYNGQDEVTGYSGSAFATVDSEKQLFTHDDTLVHAVNSAQYALGVNLSGISADLARMMGMDETMLWSGTLTANGDTAQLSENLSSFEKIKIQWKGENTGYALRENTFVNDGNNFSTITIGGAAQLYSNYALSMNAAYLTATNDVFTLVRQFRENIASSNKVESFSNSNGMIHIYKFIGIGRKN